MRRPTADLVLTGARVRLGQGQWAGAVAVRGGRISAIGPDFASVRDLIGPHTRVIESPGGLVVPGFQDSHVHAPFAGLDRRRLSLHDVQGRSAYLEAIALYAQQHPSKPWIVGGGWAAEHFPNGRPRKEDLDTVVPDRPVFLLNGDLHGAWLNSRALEVVGITRNTPDPVDGRIDRDPVTGNPSGTLQEGAAYWINDHFVPQPDQQEWEAAVLDAQRYLHSLGITGWQDAWVTPATQAAYESLAAQGRLTARVVGALWWDRKREMEQLPELLARRERGLAVVSPTAHLGSGFFPTSVKIMTDGVLENFTGALLEPYCDGCGGHSDRRGVTYLDRDLLATAVTELDAQGFQVHFHAIGDRAVRESLDAIHCARSSNGRNDRRHQIAHVQVVQPEDIVRFNELEVVANCQTFWAQSASERDDLTIPFLGTERARLQFPFAGLLASGARLAMGSDWAVTTADPLQQLEVAVTRTSPQDRDRAPFLPEQCMSLDDALDAFTAGSSYVNHDDQGGRIAVGSRADLALLDTDIFAPGFVTNHAAPISDARVQITVAGGSVVYDAEG
ncbi:amidohydrolase [Streptomyces cinerochromogenes]|uniref:amidohydrolase n=1 Tax=Streptomyces cinerochromogenes TaxID=66422 RepID=UPI00167139A9|nr:amidohydrolase [Streptomyces cinerochromogenes]GGS93564.1 amidohydrolase [Streptomyces cinerochromogenes]